MDRTYRRLCARLGAAMLCHHVLINVLVSGVLIGLEFASLGMDDRTYNLVYELVYAALYLTAFMLPVAFFALLDRGETRCGMGMAPSLTWRAVPMIFAVLGVNIPCAYLNGLFMQALEAIGISDLLGYVEMPLVYPEDYVLLHMSLALVPAFCEEFLFRGLICRRLMPYGRAVAVLGSAVLFGLMHGNLGQLFYTTMAGVMLGWCFVETGSIWPGVIAHMLNNLTGFVAESWYQNLPEARAVLYDGLLSAGIVLVGMVCLVYLFARRRNVRPRMGLGSTCPLPDTPDTALPMGVAIRGFFRPTMVVYFVLALGGILLYLGLGAMMGWMESVGMEMPY